MPIPNFDHNDVLPPHTGNPINRSDLSPYHCSTLELCHRFATSRQRVIILKNFIAFRKRMSSLGIVEGFQYLGGSFLQNIENEENRSPRDLDVVTFFGGLTKNEQGVILANFPEFAYSGQSKVIYLLDHYPVDYCSSPEITVEQTRYWIQLFTHTRSRVWKGMLRIKLDSATDDQLALAYLNSVVL